MNKKDFKYIEYNKDFIYRKKSQILDLEDLRSRKGFRSVYQINEEGKQWVEDHGGVSGFGTSGLPVWSDYLYIEFDDNKAAAKRLFNYLRDDGIGFAMYESGNRSFHFHIMRDIAPHADVPYTDRLFVEKIAPEADMSLYRHLQPWRIVGTLHKKTNKPKRLLRVNEGKSIKLSIVEKQQRERHINESHMIFDDDTIFAMSCIGATDGERNVVLSSLTRKLNEYGAPREVIEWWVETVNERCDPPESERTVRSIIKCILGGS